MSKIKIKHFGPIKEGYQEDDGFLDIKKVTLFTGNQGSGKSTIAKLISTFTWIEKTLVRGDYDKKWFERKNRFRNQCLTYHRLENYIHSYEGSDQSEIDYQGEAYHILYSNGNLTISENERKSYPLPQIMYVPAERNFIANVKTPKALKLTSDSLIEFVTEFDNAKDEIKGSLSLPINNVDIEYDKLNDVVNLKGKDYKLRLTEASSGFQSFVPLFLVSWYLSIAVSKQREDIKDPMSSEELERFRNGVAEIWSNESMTEEQRRVALSVLSSRFNKTAFVNIVEEPEQNLFPISQWKMLNSLVAFNNSGKQNKLIITTHSPYLINYLTLSVKAYMLHHQLSKLPKNDELNKKLFHIVPQNSLVHPDEWAIYELSEQEGSIVKVQRFNGLPSDVNDLNEELANANELFAQLLEIQQQI